MEGNKDHRDRFHSICKEIISAGKCIRFAAILDFRGSIIVCHSNRYNKKIFKVSSFYRDSILPVITNMNRYGNNTGSRFRVINVGIGNRMAVGQLRPTDIGDENDTRRYF
jgi:hypothetical protein